MLIINNTWYVWTKKLMFEIKNNVFNLKKKIDRTYNGTFIWQIGKHPDSYEDLVFMTP